MTQNTFISDANILSWLKGIKQG